MTQASAETEIPYLKSSNFLRTWSERTCEKCEIEGAALSTDRAAPPVAHGQAVQSPVRPEKEVPSRPKKAPDDPYLRTINAGFKAAAAVSSFSNWLSSPPSPVKAKAAPTPAPKPIKKVPPFDIQDVPKAMRKVGMPMAAKLQDRWFAGAANYSRSTADLQAEIDQNSARYAPSMVDSTTIKMDWVLSFSRAKQAFDDLVQNRLTRPAALKQLGTQLAPYGQRHDVVAWNIANSDFWNFIRNFSSN